MARGGGLLFFILYLALGVYFLNVGFGFINMPDAISNIEKWIIVVGGVFLVFGGFNFLRVRREAAH